MSQGRQYANAFYRWKEAMKSAGWTVEISCDSTVALDDGTDLITDPTTDVVWGSSSQDRSYIVLASPAGLTDNDGQPIRFLLEARNDSGSGDTTPTQVFTELYRCPVSKASSNDTRTTPTADFAFCTRSVTSRNLLPFPSATEAYSHAWWNDKGEMWFGITGSGQNGFPMLVAFVGHSGTESPTKGYGRRRFGFFSGMSSSNIVSVVDSGQFKSTGFWQGFSEDGEPSSCAAYALPWEYASVNDGQVAFGGQVLASRVSLFGAGAGSESERYSGELDDVLAVSLYTATTSPLYDDVADALIYRPLPRAGIALPTLSADGAITF